MGGEAREDLSGPGWLSGGEPPPIPLAELVLPPEEGCECGQYCPFACEVAQIGTDAATGMPAEGVPAEGVPAAALPADGVPAEGAPVPVVWATPGVPLAPAGPPAVLVQLAAALAAVRAAGPLSGSAADTALLLSLSEQASGLALRELAQMDAVGGHQQPGVRSTTASWLRDSQLLTDTAARSAVRLAVQLRDDLPGLGELLQTGQITRAHASAVTGGVHGLDRDIVRDAQDGLCALAQATDPVSVRTQLRDKAHAVDDRLAAHAERKARDRMGLRLSQLGGNTVLEGNLAGDVGATVRLAFDLAVQAGRTDGDTRGRPARHADVLHDWAADYLSTAHGAGDSLAADAHTVRTHLLITCTPEQLAATATATAADQPRPTLAQLLADPNGTAPVSARIAGDACALSRGALRRLACDATLSLITLTGAASDQYEPGDANPADQAGQVGTAAGGHSCPLYVGRSSRTVNGRQFAALVVRDRHCVVQGCHRPPARCAAHHVLHWADGGPTDLDNLVLLCHHHDHHDHHDRGQDLPHHDRQRWLTQTGWRHGP